MDRTRTRLEKRENEEANRESSIFLALSKWKFVKQPVSMMCKYTVRYTLCSNK